MILRACIAVPLLLVLVVHFALAQNPQAVKTLPVMLGTGTPPPDPAHSGPAMPAHPEVLRFQKVQISEYFWSEGTAIADINRDEHIDIVAGPFWYQGPEFKVRHEIFSATQTFKRQRANGTEETVEGFEGALGTHNAYSNAFFEFVYDFNHDGWPDVLVIGFPGEETAWYENPGPVAGPDRHWQRHVVIEGVTNESPAFVDLLATGTPVIVCTMGMRLGYVAPDSRGVSGPWTFHAISPFLPSLEQLTRTFGAPFGGKPWPFAHGLGYGDVNGGGRLDVLDADGWWEQPPSVSGDPVWKFHPWPFLKRRPAAATQQTFSAPPTDDEFERVLRYYKWPYSLGGAQIIVSDVNGDGLPDIISSLDAHGYGLAWFEQLPGSKRQQDTQFRPHFIMNPGPAGRSDQVSFTQLHALSAADLEGAGGGKDIITGKRFWAHGPEGHDPENEAPAVLYAFRRVRHGHRRVDFVPILIDSDSGIGTQLAVGDVNGDGLPDIVISNKKGTFLFLQQAACPRTVQ
jgi:hypothetical protein